MSNLRVLRRALEPFAALRAGDGDTFATYPDDCVVRCEVTAGEVKAARAALAGFECSNEVEVEVEEVARALHAAFSPYADYTYEWDNPLSSQDMFRALASAAIGTVSASVDRAARERDAYRTLAVEQGWNNTLAEAYGHEVYRRMREAFVDETCAAFVAKGAEA